MKHNYIHALKILTATCLLGPLIMGMWALGVIAIITGLAPKRARFVKEIGGLLCSMVFTVTEACVAGLIWRDPP